MTVYNIIQELRSNNSGNFKKSIMEKYNDNEELKEFFRLCLDKQLNFYIRKIPKYNTNHLGDITLKDAMGSLSKLSSRMFTGKKASIYLSKLLTRCTLDDSEVIKMIIKRDPSCGVSVLTVNKIWPGLIELWPCHLCERSTEKNLANIVYPAIIQEKADGMRINIVYDNTEDKIFYKSRNGNFVLMYNSLDEEVRQISKYVNGSFVIDGEALVWDESGSEVLDRQSGNGIMNKAIQNTISEEEAKRVFIRMWDIIPYDEFKTGIGTEHYLTTIKKINFILKKENLKKFEMILTKIVKIKEQALKFYKIMLSKEKEGAILKNFNSIWESKRSKDNVKLKIEEDVELIVTGWKPHRKKKNWIGKLTCESSDGIVKVNVGSGLKDPDRKKDPIYYMGRIVTVRSNGLVESKGREKKSLFLPRFKKDFIRMDKDEAQNYEDIKACFDKFLENI